MKLTTFYKHQELDPVTKKRVTKTKSFTRDFSNYEDACSYVGDWVDKQPYPSYELVSIHFHDE